MKAMKSGNSCPVLIMCIYVMETGTGRDSGTHSMPFHVVIRLCQCTHRANHRQKEVVNQLAIDEERYRAHSECAMLFCFVYDPDGYCHNPSALEDWCFVPGEELTAIVVAVPRGL